MSVDWLARSVPQASALHPYVPGKPVEQLLREKGLTRAVKLASNENPYGPSPKAMAAICAQAGQVHRYPDGDANRLRSVLAGFHHVDIGQVLVGNGSNEVLELLIRTYAGAGDEVIFSRRGFIVYALATQAAGATGVAVPEADGLSHDLESMAAAVNERTKLVCIANPNNPTGSLHGNDALQAFLDRLPRDLVVIIDEAYYEYVAEELGDSLKLLSHPGLVISRTFSKAYGLAGCRLGYAVAEAALLAPVNRFREPFNVSLLAQAAGVAALEDTEWLQQKVALCLAERLRLEQQFRAWGVLGGVSHGNFVLLRHKQSSEILHQLEQRGIIPRPLAPYGMVEFLRISVGAAEENSELLHAMTEILAGLGE